jgi:hypothetical protein
MHSNAWVINIHRHQLIRKWKFLFHQHFMTDYCKYVVSCMRVYWRSGISSTSENCRLKLKCVMQVKWNVTMHDLLRRVWRYQKGNQNSQIEEQKTQWPNEKRTKGHIKIKDRVTGTPLQTGCDVMCSGRVICSCSTSGTRDLS